MGSESITYGSELLLPASQHANAAVAENAAMISWQAIAKRVGTDTRRGRSAWGKSELETERTQRRASRLSTSIFSLFLSHERRGHKSYWRERGREGGEVNRRASEGESIQQ